MNALRDNPKPANVARVLDFPGFYESTLSAALDDAEQMEHYNLLEDHPELDDTAVGEAFYEHSTYQTGFDHIARAYVEWLNHVLDDTGVVLAFESMTSPREYNFTTDALYVTVNDPLRMLMGTRPASLNAVIEEQFTSRSGFISFYPCDPAEWRAKPLSEWDHNELGALLTAFLRQRMDEKDLDQYAMLEYLQEDFQHAVDEQTDWPALHATLEIADETV